MNSISGYMRKTEKIGTQLRGVFLCLTKTGKSCKKVRHTVQLSCYVVRYEYSIQSQKECVVHAVGKKPLR